MPRDIVRDLLMVQGCEPWPHQNWLPLTHVSEPEPGFSQVNKLGFVIRGDETTVIVGSPMLIKLGLQRLEDLAEIHYNSISEMLESWQVD